MSNDHLLIERRDNGVVLATLNRPEVLNALSPRIRSGLREMTAELRGDPDARALVITGAGRGFCSGADLSNRDERVAAESQPGLTSTELRYGFAAELQQLEIPVIAAVNGAAAGAGFAIALAADIRLMSENARFHPGFMKIGLGPDWAASWTLTRLVGHSRALETFWTSDPIDADRALELGIANRVVAHDDLMPEALALAERLARNAPWAMALTKRAIYAALNNDATEQAQLEELNQAWLRNSLDAGEGARTFRERRDPNFQRR
jgi:2-(1,2-epoxy-1,2-dihydrophenyl)acetyl-CoA isomerase